MFTEIAYPQHSHTFVLWYKKSVRNCK